MAAGMVAVEDTRARELEAGPDDYRAQIGVLQPGDTLRLKAGVYRDTLRLHRLDGGPDHPITIEGAATGDTVFYAKKGHNTVSLFNSSYLIIRNLSIDGRGLGMDGVKAEGPSDYAHHITLENLRIFNLGGDQQTVGISTKCHAWSWTVRGNRIRGAGTGMYFGSSDGNVAFVNSIIDGNQVIDSAGYDLQIKHLVAHPDEVPGFPDSRTETVIRNNFFSKTTPRNTRSGDRPSVLVGHAPLTGNGVDDWVLVYGNLFFQNPDEALFQGEGNVALFNNLFFNAFDSSAPAVVIQPHNCVPRRIRVFNNTVVARGPGIVVRGGSPLYEQSVFHNAVFADPPVRSKEQSGNLTAGYEVAGDYLVQPSIVTGCLDLAPRARAALISMPEGRAAVREFEAANKDFFGTPRKSDVPGAILPEGVDTTRLCLTSDGSPVAGAWPPAERRQP